ncbi:transcriptional regulator, DeoR family [Reichenbachiella faecimaris]|uniref:Transcriptional regulator, DeoR family n=1 Tax=Reichenbachiella faecimaris TaxID=692418 RepID=A0A1W2G873_REIFA|nr:DeoR/GlpR family DNA-binding transcription regulator [Reichenbachiella faecimaris]SMD32833.1 transcriptional regulator, DeoR family [Reichenbachiella faecimaris]
MRNKHATVSRRKSILQMVNENSEVFVDELSNLFSVSEVTIRNDLDQLEKKQLLIRARGGAMKFEGRVGIDLELSSKDKIHLDEKIRIGKKAAELVKDGDIILIDSGTTTAEMVKNLDGIKNLTVITNAINIVILLMNKPNVNLIIPGGFLRQNSQSLVGPMAEKGLKNLNVDKVFLGADGFDTSIGLYTPNLEEAQFNEKMIQISKEIIALTDSTKFSRRSFAFFCDVSDVTTVVTDAIEPQDRAKLDEHNVEILLA